MLKEEMQYWVQRSSLVIVNRESFHDDQSFMRQWFILISSDLQKTAVEI